MAMAATTKVRIGATRAGTITFSMIPSPRIALVPSAANVAPTMPPIRACEDDDGSPKYHVSRFQKMAPTRPAKTMGSVMNSASTIPLAIVAATSIERKAPTKFSAAAMVTATRGAMARVEIDVATAFAVSWKPFVKSKASAVPTTIQRITSFSMAGSGSSGVLDDDALEDVGRLLRGVDGVLEALEDVLPADDHHGVDPALEQRGQRFADHPIALVLEPVDLDREVVDVLERPQAGDRQADLAGGLRKDPRHVLGLLHRRLDAVQPHEVRDLLDEVDDVVERRGQRVDVLTVDRRDERRVQPLDDVVGDAIALLLADDHVTGQLTMVGPLPEHALQQLGRPDDVGARLLEQVEELALLGSEQLG